MALQGGTFFQEKGSPCTPSQKPLQKGFGKILRFCELFFTENDEEKQRVLPITLFSKFLKGEWGKLLPRSFPRIFSGKRFPLHPFPKTFAERLWQGLSLFRIDLC